MCIYEYVDRGTVGRPPDHWQGRQQHRIGQWYWVIANSPLVGRDER